MAVVQVFKNYKKINRNRDKQETHSINQEVVCVAKKEKKEITCTFEFTEGAQDRITDAFVDAYYKIKDGIYKGPLLEKKNEETA